MQAMSPDGEAIVTGAGDETLRFWNVFSKMRSTKVPTQLLFFFFYVLPNAQHWMLMICFSFVCLKYASVIRRPPFSGIRLGAEPLHQDPVVCSPRERRWEGDSSLHASNCKSAIFREGSLPSTSLKSFSRVVAAVGRCCRDAQSDCGALKGREQHTE